MNGAIVIDKNTVKFRFFSPFAKKAKLKLLTFQKQLVDMQKVDENYFEVTVSDICLNEDYVFVIDDTIEASDPASRRQPLGVFSPSRIYDTNHYQWKISDWKSFSLSELIFYELHIGTFTHQGNFKSAIKKLDHLVQLGVNAIEMMPVSSFSGTRNWGYDAVFPYAPQESYGGPDGLKEFVDACHAKKIAVFLDVVYNHIGPQGSVLHQYGPYFTEKYQTPWGKALNYDGPYSDGVRDYIIDNALYLVNEFNLDGLRLDAVHAIYDFSAYHILAEMQDTIRKNVKRDVYLIAESDLNDCRIVNKKQKGGYDLDGQWNDDYHHALHACLTHDNSAYFVDFGKVADLAKAIQKGFVYDGQKSIYRKRRHGNSSEHLSGEKLVIFSQNHDQIANALSGKRESAYLNIDQQKLVAMFLILMPNLPLLFMGQEWGAKTPFDYFTDFHDPILAEAVSSGRKKEYSAHNICENFKDPQDPATFENSKLDWNELKTSAHQHVLDFYKKLIALRKQHPSLNNTKKDLLEVDYSEDEKWLAVLRKDPKGDKHTVFTANLCKSKRKVPIKWEAKELIISSSDAQDTPYTGCLYVFS